MLKLEKIGHSRDISVSFRDKPRFFNRTFVLSLGMALFFHSAALVLFHIAPFKIGYQDSVSPSAFVATDFNDASFVDAGHLDLNHESIPEYLAGPLKFHLGAPSLQLKVLYAEPKEYSQLPVKSKNNTFTALEDRIKLQSLHSFFDDQPAKSAVDVHISGSLAEVRAHYDMHMEEFIEGVASGKIDNISSLRRFCYDVQVESSFGKVFWWEASFADGEPYFKELSIDILKSLHFSLPAHHPIQKGCIEITFSPLFLAMVNFKEVTQ